ncbi:MAG: hypothetical protein Greene041619_619 [Candidatus Peregrinibacteria bacterium Greene0416_19]|nr:MAG: hypothetical protein Greene041619_619 [Candidatus Peregrinibacteria bacterium Greene0416_19]
MLSIERCRKILGKKANDLTDKEVEELCDRVYALADVTLEQTLKELLPNRPLPSTDSPSDR